MFQHLFTVNIIPPAWSIDIKPLSRILLATCNVLDIFKGQRSLIFVIACALAFKVKNTKLDLMKSSCRQQQLDEQE